ncbi:hypothetical protein [Vineibacter terrae]
MSLKTTTTTTTTLARSGRPGSRRSPESYLGGEVRKSGPISAPKLELLPL